MSSSTLYSLTKEDIPKAVETLKDAFSADPLWEEVFKEDPDQDQSLTAFFTCPLLYGMKFGKACATSPSAEGVAVWVPGKYADMSMWGMLRSGALFYGMKMGKQSVQNLAIVSKQTGHKRKKLMRNQAYKYLTIIGISSAAQGNGFGSKLMDTIKQECDNEGLNLYLETEKEENLRFYEKHGFTVLERINLPKLDLPMWLMFRKHQ